MSQRSFTETLSFAIAVIALAIAISAMLLFPILEPLFRRPEDGPGIPPLLVLVISVAGLAGALAGWWNNHQVKRRGREHDAGHSARTR